MQVNALPYAVQLRELHRQELYAQADRERLTRQVNRMAPRQRWNLSDLWVYLTGSRIRVVGQRCRLCPAATGVFALTAD